MKRVWRRGGITLLLGLAVGCDHSSLDDLHQVQANLHRHYEIQKQDTTKLSAKEKRIRQQRLRMQFGDAAG